MTDSPSRMQILVDKIYGKKSITIFPGCGLLRLVSWSVLIIIVTTSENIDLNLFNNNNNRIPNMLNSSID